MNLTINILLCVAAMVSISIGQGEIPKCPPGESTQLAHPNCSIFIVCENGLGSEMACPEGLYYNSVSTLCDFPENVPECIDGTRPPALPSTTTQIPTEPTSTITSTQILTSPTSVTTTTERPTSAKTTTVATTVNPTTSPPTTSQPPETLTQCGQVTYAHSGYIEYKLNQTYNSDELCAFVIRFRTAFGCTFTLLNSGVKDTTSDIISLIRVSNDETNLQTTRISTVGSTVLHANSNFVVVFRTTTNQGTGFRLQFERPDAPGSTDPGLQLAFNDRLENPLTFPLLPDAIGKNERDTIVITPDAKWSTESYLKLQVYHFLNPGCGSFYKLYEFYGEYTRWNGKVCGGREGNFTEYTTPGLFIVVFQKNGGSTESYLGALDWSIQRWDESINFKISKDHSRV